MKQLIFCCCVQCLPEECVYVINKRSFESSVHAFGSYFRTLAVFLVSDIFLLGKHICIYKCMFRYNIFINHFLCFHSPVDVCLGGNMSAHLDMFQEMCLCMHVWVDAFNVFM